MLLQGPRFCLWPELIRICRERQSLLISRRLGKDLLESSSQVFKPASARIIFDGHVVYLIQGRSQDRTDVWQLPIHNCLVVRGPEDLGSLFRFLFFACNQECVEGKKERLLADFSMHGGVLPFAVGILSGLPR